MKETFPVISRVAVIAAGMEMALVLLLVGVGVDRWTLLFLGPPALVLIASRYSIRSATIDAGCLPWAALGINFAVLLSIAIMSGGGV